MLLLPLPKVFYSKLVQDYYGVVVAVEVAKYQEEVEVLHHEYHVDVHVPSLEEVVDHENDNMKDVDHELTVDKEDLGREKQQMLHYTLNVQMDTLPEEEDNHSFRSEVPW